MAPESTAPWLGRVPVFRALVGNWSHLFLSCFHRASNDWMVFSGGQRSIRPTELYLQRLSKAMLGDNALL